MKSSLVNICFETELNCVLEMISLSKMSGVSCRVIVDDCPRRLHCIYRKSSTVDLCYSLMICHIKVLAVQSTPIRQVQSRQS